MVCCGGKRAKQRAKKYEKKYGNNIVHPMSLQPVNKVFVDKFANEVVYCGGCHEPFRIGSDEIKIHCNICNKFFHCKIAGTCMGEDCLLIKADKDGSIHRASYCYDCIGVSYKNNTCLCKDCHQT